MTHLLVDCGPRAFTFYCPLSFGHRLWGFHKGVLCELLLSPSHTVVRAAREAPRGAGEQPRPVPTTGAVSFRLLPALHVMA